MSRLIKIIPFVLIILLFSCAEKEDCIGCNMNPKIKVNFEPVASKKKIDSLFTGVSDQIEKLVDSLSLGLTGAQKSAVQQQLEKLREDSTNLNEDYTIFRSKKTKISELSAPGAVGLEIFQDTIIQKLALP